MDIAVKNTDVEIPKKQLMRYHQREDQKGEIEAMESMLPHLKNSQDKGQVTQRIRRLKTTLESQSPAPLAGSAKDKIAARAKALEEKITAGMLSKEEMRKNPAGAVGQHMRWEKANKPAIMEWKNAMQMLEPDSNDPDLSNLERLRPEGQRDRFRADAQITGKMSYLHVPEENWKQAFEGKEPENTALKQAKRVAEENNLEVKQKKGMSDEARKAAAERMRKMHAQKRQQAAVQQSDRDLPIVQEGEAVTNSEG
jgi:hypothetical protein